MDKTTVLKAYVLVNLADLGVKLEQYTSDSLPLYILSITDQDSIVISVQDHAGNITKVLERAVGDISTVTFPERKKMNIEYKDSKAVAVHFTGHKEKVSLTNLILSLFMAAHATDKASMYGVSDAERFITYFKARNLTTSTVYSGSRSKLPILAVVGFIIVLFILVLFTIL